MKRLTERIIYCGKPAITMGGHVYCKGDYKYYQVSRLAEYEDAEEEGRMIILPVPIGTTVYEIYDFDDLDYDIDEHKIRLEDLKNIGDTVFITREEAESRLKELGKEKINI